MIFAKPDRRWIELLILTALVCLTTPVFWLTDLDHKVAALFYQRDSENTPWPQQEWWLWRTLFRYAFVFVMVVIVAALLVIVSGYFLPDIKQWRRPAIFILLAVALGPGLVVNLIFKDHWGRPRPLHISEFGGTNDYIPPLQIGYTPHKSFPCGHCSVGFAFFALYFLSRKRKRFYLIFTMVAGLTMGLARMSAGGHFISDILWSGYLVFAVDWLIYYGWYLRGDGRETVSL